MQDLVFDPSPVPVFSTSKKKHVIMTCRRLWEKTPYGAVKLQRMLEEFDRRQLQEPSEIFQDLKDLMKPVEGMSSSDSD